MTISRNIVPIESLKKGDRFTEDGGVFELLEDPRPSFSHGRVAVVYAPCVTISGEITGYFKPGSDWTLQGRVNLVTKHKV